MQIPRLHQDTIEEVKQRADIVDVISEHVILRKRGKDYVGLCPFHEEKSPSFTVSPSNQMYYCFGCQAGGNVITFLKELGKRPFSEVVLDLARRYQVSVQTLEPEQRQELQRRISMREQLYEIVATASKFYEHALRQSQGQQALEYLKSERHLSEETIQQFQLGYAPASWETIYRYLVEQKRYSVQLVEQAGLIKQRQEGSGYYDRFRDRLIVPIHDIQGRVIGFGGRTLSDEQPKYLNSPETDLFDKGKTLFALNKAKDAIAKQDRVVVVEGYFDAIALHAAGITNAVASLGTALSLDQVRLLLRYTESKQIVLNFDADAAGTKAAQRAIGEIADLAYKGEVNLRILNLPDGKDADEFLKEEAIVENSNLRSAKKRSEQYKQLLDNAPLWIYWQIQQLLVDRDLNQADQFQQTVSQMVKLLCNITEPNTRQHYIQQCAELLGRGDTRLIPRLVENIIAQIKKPQTLPKATTKKPPQLPPLPIAPDRNLLEQAEALLLQIYLHYPEYRQAVMNALDERDLPFSLSHHRVLWQQILSLPDDRKERELISLLQNRCEEFPKEFALVSHLFYLDEKAQLDMSQTPLVIQAAVASMERVIAEKTYRRFLDLWQQTDPTKESKCREYQQKIYQEKLRIEELDKQRRFLLIANR